MSGKRRMSRKQEKDEWETKGKDEWKTEKEEWETKEKGEWETGEG